MVKRLIFLGTIVLVTFVSSCKKEKKGLVGTWRLTEELMDPGDGSGAFTPVSSTKIIELFADGTYQSNGGTCYMSSLNDQNSSGTYANGIMEASGCFQVTLINYELKDDELILHYPCYEGCAQKYSKQ